MKAQRVNDLLLMLKTCTPEIQEKSRRLLKYIYQDVYQDSLKKTNDCADFSGSEIKKFIKPFLDEPIDSIIDYFYEMINDGKIEFINAFFDKTDSFFDIIDNHFYTIEDFKIISFTFNIYCMLKAYHEHKDNFDLYSMILKDCSKLINCNFMYNNFYSNSYSDSKKVFDAAISAKTYDKVPFIRDTLHNYLYNFSSISADFELKTISYIEKIYRDINDLKQNTNYALISFDEALNKLVSIERYFSPFLSRKYDYYHRYLLIGNRLDYFNDMLNSNIYHKFRTEIFNRIKGLNFQLFDHLDEVALSNGENEKKDSFIECLKIVFDSDSYHEINSKLIYLTNYVYVGNTQVEAAKLIKNLSDIGHKKIVEGKPFMYEDDSLNKVSKPDNITSRMYLIYKKLYGDEIDVAKILDSVLDTRNLSIDVFEQMVDDKIAEVKRQNAMEKVNGELDTAVKEIADGVAYASIMDARYSINSNKEIDTSSYDSSSNSSLKENNNGKDNDSEVEEENKSLRKRRGLFGKRS